VTTEEDADYAELMHRCPKHVKIMHEATWLRVQSKRTDCYQCHEKAPEDIQTTLALFNMHKPKKRSMYDDIWDSIWMAQYKHSSIASALLKETNEITYSLSAEWAVLRDTLSEEEKDDE